ncbi:hypothetical protein ABAC460_18000 [Asticcacaulis sp. AC460]|uniref:molybdopterin molybdotransferase MoeA n=1 Tax=Asticcacaulis sp. AC460 TaxID=1282360 RepID=UPI0003C3CE9B|nr:molybdopterin molybdotransferase MoeA [Asticcacaulis sp. AC460]ESQ88086.1 hypothetical protein ABAC460_18000 [Asticcacaulis sp. AC460]
MTPITMNDAIEIVVSHSPAVSRISKGLRHAFGRVAAEDIDARRDQPPFASSAMDGYAIIKPDAPSGWEDTFVAVGESQAGARFRGVLAKGEAVRIFTGAPVPEAATAVVLQENAIVADGGIRFEKDASTDKPHIRSQGHDFHQGDILITAGERLDAWRLALAAAAGRGSLLLAKRPRIAILTTGNELVPPGGEAGTDQIFESNSVALCSLVTQWGGKPRVHGIGPDDAEVLIGRIASIDADLIVTVGGASVGDYDLVKPALARLGFRALFEKVNVRPGKPTSFGRLQDDRLVLGLPGNPGACLTMAQLLLKPFIRAALGQARDSASCLPLGSAVPANGPREAYLRAQLACSPQGQTVVHPFADQDSAMIRNFAEADVLIKRPANALCADIGECVPVIPLERL